jgi:hypothetical protein
MNEEQMESLEACESAADWRKACDAIKASSPSKVCYPDDWGEKVIKSGFMDRITSRWLFNKSNLHVTSFNTLDELKKKLRS